MYPSSSLTDAEWVIVEGLLPPPGNWGGKGGRHEKYCRRVIVDAIFYVVRGGIAWRQLPRDFPPAMTVYTIFRRWSAAGAWHRVHDFLRDRVRVRAGRAPQPTAAIINSQPIQGSDTVPVANRGYDAGKKTNGRQTSHRRRQPRAAADRRCHRRLHSGP
ncbi:transposase [Nocardia terpenica]|uniref:transposase n=1 Tax=Nocardia terpenica TaxID=455432 RepID=UPI002FCD55B2